MSTQYRSRNEDDFDEDEESDFDEDSFTESEISEFSDEVDPAWKDEVSKDGELFYVEENVENTSEDKEESKMPVTPEHNLHGTSQEISQSDLSDARKNARFRPIERQEVETYNISSNQEIEVRNQNNNNRKEIREIDQDLYTEPRGPPDNGGLLDLRPFKLHSEQASLKDVVVSVNAASSYGRKGLTSLLESMLGIISSNDRTRNQHLGNFPNQNKLLVNGLVPNGPAFLNDNVVLGDTLLALNGVAVDRSNIEEVLSRVPEPMDLKLTFQCRPRNSDSESSSLSSGVARGQRLNAVAAMPDKLKSDQIISPSTMDKVITTVGSYHAVFFLTLNVSSETARGEEDVLYSYPTDETPSSKKLKSVRGIFTTLADVSRDAFKSRVLSSTLAVDGELVHCAYYHCGSEVLVICVPASLRPLSHLHKVVTNMVRLLNIMFRSLSMAFTQENASKLDHLFYLFFTANTWSSFPEVDLQGLINPPISGIRTLSLREDLFIDVDVALTEFEAADFDDGTNNQGLSRRLYNILGSCLFYKGYLIANHLHQDDLKDVHIFCQSYALLGKLRKGQLLIWRQVYPSRRKNFIKKSKTKTYREFQETEGKYFLLVVGLRYSLLCVVMEAGGGAVAAIGKLGPDPMYVDRARATILQLESVDIPAGIDDQLIHPSVPLVTSADVLVKKPQSSFFGGNVSHNKPPSGSGQSKLDVTTSSNQGTIKLPITSSKKGKKHNLETSKGNQSLLAQNSPKSIDKSGSSPRFLRRIGSQKSLVSQGSADSVGSVTKGIRNLASAFSMSDLRNTQPSTEKFEMKKLTAGADNILFHYIHFESQSGIIITPTDQEVACLDGSFHRHLVDNFRQCALLLHERLSNSERKNPNQTCYEEGVFFHCQMASILLEGNKKPTPFVQYWVVGRSIPRPRPCQFYVCFQDSAQQNVLELAFRMGFGRDA